MNTKKMSVRVGALVAWLLLAVVMFITDDPSVLGALGALSFIMTLMVMGQLNVTGRW